jgi:WhiB family redox-sensing transcriptional regulator
VTRIVHTATVPDTAERPGAWRESAVCAGVDPELFFPAKGDAYAASRARRICAACPVRMECLEDALQREAGRGFQSRHGIVGGLGPRKRYDLNVARRKAAA